MLTELVSVANGTVKYSKTLAGRIEISALPDVGLLPSEYVIFPHRGGTTTMPDGALSSYKRAVAAGYAHIDVDLHLLSDGAVAVMHDATVDATTDGVGNVNTFSTATFRALKIDAGTWLAAGYESESPPLFEDLLKEFAGRGVIYSIECKVQAAIKPVIALLKQYNVPHYCVFPNSFTLADCVIWAKAGYQPGHIADPATSDFPALAAVGVKYVLGDWVGQPWTAPLVASAAAFGILPVAYGVTRRTQADAARALGIVTLVADDPDWLRDVDAPVYDSWATKRWSRGSALYQNSRGAFLGTDAWGYTDQNIAVYQGAMQSVCPIKTPASYVLRFKLQFDAVTSNSRWGGVTMCMPDDTVFDDASPNKNSAYHILFRQSGTIDVFLIAGGQPSAGNANIGSVAGATQILGNVYDIEITVSPSQLVIKNVTHNNTLTVVNSAYRGGYFQLGRNGSAVRFSALSVTPT